MVRTITSLVARHHTGHGDVGACDVRALAIVQEGAARAIHAMALRAAPRLEQVLATCLFLWRYCKPALGPPQSYIYKEAPGSVIKILISR